MYTFSTIVVRAALTVRGWYQDFAQDRDLKAKLCVSVEAEQKMEGENSPHEATPH